MADAKKIVPPAPRVESDRTVLVPPSIDKYDTSEDKPPRYKTRANFREEEFVRVLDQHGKYVFWKKALLCPCLNEVTGQVQLECHNCNGSGYVYVDKLEIRAHMASFDRKTTIYEKFGLWQEGNVMITVEPKYRLGFRDIIQMRDEIMTFSELLKKGNRRGIRSKLPSGRDSAQFRIVSATHICYLKGEELIHLEEGTHFEVDENGWLAWTTAGNRVVPDGTILSVTYDYCPTYMIVSHPHATRDDVSGRKTVENKVLSLPLQAAAKLSFLVDSNTLLSMEG